MGKKIMSRSTAEEFKDDALREMTGVSMPPAPGEIMPETMPESTAETVKPLSSLRYEDVVLGNKGKLPFKDCEWRPFPRSIASKHHLLNMKLEVSGFGAVVTRKGLVKAHPDVVSKWLEACDLSSLKLYTDFNSEVSIHSSKDGPVLRLRNGKEIQMKRIVAEAFIPNPMGKPCVACLNGDSFDLTVGNLMWMTRSEIYNFKTKGVIPCDMQDKKKDLTWGLLYDGRYDFASRILRLEVRLSEYNGVSEHLNLHGFRNNAVDAARIYFFIKFWNNYGIHDFGVKELSVYTGVSGHTVDNAVDALIKSGLLLYDKSLWRKRQGAYEYTALECARIDISGSISLMYTCRDARIDEMFVLYVKSLRDDVFKPEWNPEWDGLHYEHPSYYYESDYGALTYRYVSDPDDMLERIKESHFVANCVANLKKPFTWTESSGRAWPAFARSRREYRHGFEYNGSPLTELVDIHCSFYTIFVKLLKDLVPEGERLDFFDECFSGKLYDNCAAFMNKNKGRKDKDKVYTRDDAKELMQAWRNDIDGKRSSKKVQEFMEKYPHIKAVIDKWPTYTDKDGEIHKLIQRDCGTIETKLMSKLASEIHNKYKVKCFLLHDAIYVSEKDKAENLPENINEEIHIWLRDNILK